MLSQRKKTLAPPRTAPPKDESGIQFPRNDKGERSTSTTGQVCAYNCMKIGLHRCLYVKKRVYTHTYIYVMDVWMYVRMYV